MLHTCVASTDRDLTTTSRVRSLVLGATATSTAYDSKISAMIRAASRWAESYVGYPLTAASYLETLPGYDRRTLMLARAPVRAVRRLFDSTDTGEATQILTTEFRVEDRDAAFLTRDVGWAWSVPAIQDLSARPDAGQEFRPWLADYVAGYTYDGLDTGSPHWSTEHGTTSTERTLPEDIEEAVVRKAAALYENSDDVVEEQLGDLKVTYRSERVDDPAPATPEFFLRPYRRLV